MKNNIVFKFIAIVLCAASLLGALGGILGVVTMTSWDLYNKTVDQIREDQVRLNSAEYANELALMYASSSLGGCSETLVQNVFHTGSRFERNYSDFGYTILDAEGNVLSAFRPELKDTASSYTFPINGQYMHLVSEAPVVSVDDQIAAQQAELSETVTTHPDLPPEGIGIDRVMFTALDGTPIYEASCYNSEFNVTYHYGDSSSGYGFTSSQNLTGYLFSNPFGQVIYTSYADENFEPLPETEIYGAYFYNDALNYNLRILDDMTPVGSLTRNNGVVLFQSFPILATADAAESEEIPETEPEVTEETIPETTEALITETIPVETVIVTDEYGNPIAAVVSEATAPVAETEPVLIPEVTDPAAVTAETVPSLASAIPEASIPADSIPVESLPAETAIPGLLPSEPIPVEPLPPETLPSETVPEETVAEETVPETTEPVLINGKTLDNYQVNTQDYHNGTETVHAKYVYLPMPEMTVEVYVDPATMYNAPMYALLVPLREIRNYLLPAIGICLLMFAVFAVYLCTAAGRKPKTEEVRAGGLNRLPLDLYFFGGAFCIALCSVYGSEALNYLIRQDLLVGCYAAAGLFFLASLIFVGFCFAFVAQIKTPDGFWWRNSLCGRCIRLFMRFGLWLEAFLSEKGLPWLGRSLRKLWQLTMKATLWCFHAFESAANGLLSVLGKAFRWMGSKVNRFASLLPLTWQWLVVGFVIILCSLLVSVRNIFFILLGIFIPLAIILYAAHCFGVLHDSAKRMSKGDLNTKVEDHLMAGCFQEFAGDLNALADVAVVAAQKQLKSERMKTELITNVSHDIKTPLTSIINYVDLLQKPHTEEEESQYLEVLDRQSQQLKKLIDDLMDMSKASTGNMTVEITQVDAVESVNQALGEFADKLDRALLIPVFRHDDAQVPMMADGKLVWRVLSNLLTNAVKYAMPGTRLYVDLMKLEGNVILSLKNISREELNVDAEELMERFVRGDDSRNTEGSGLGLNIAKSLMELQKGQLQILVDGDLFKVTLIFPGI